MLYANAVCLLDENRNAMKKNTNAVLVANKETGVEVMLRKLMLPVILGSRPDHSYARRLIRQVYFWFK
jgi:hypothetical protein